MLQSRFDIAKPNPVNTKKVWCHNIEEREMNQNWKVLPVFSLHRCVGSSM